MGKWLFHVDKPWHSDKYKGNKYTLNILTTRHYGMDFEAANFLSGQNYSHPTLIKTQIHKPSMPVCCVKITGHVLPHPLHPPSFYSLLSAHCNQAIAHAWLGYEAICYASFLLCTLFVDVCQIEVRVKRVYTNHSVASGSDWLVSRSQTLFVQGAYRLEIIIDKRPAHAKRSAYARLVTDLFSL